jgi:redox-sensitive bicupin YhaK (pirin superfamily)
MTALDALLPLRQPRRVERCVAGHATSDGAGVRLTRLLTPDLQQRLDPFLMLDAFGSERPGDYIAGFPDHPHRGFETVTLMLAGRMRHRDSVGHEGLLQDGGVQWMTAGRGVIHSEMPQQSEGLMEGFQLWLNLPARDKMCAPWYQDFQAADLPCAHTAQGVTVTVIAGESHGVCGAVQREATAPLLLDLALPPGARFEQALPADFHAFLVVVRGAVRVADAPVPPGQLALLDNNPQADGVALQADTQARVLLVAGRPLHEPIAQYGPFVMNTPQQIVQALSDYRDGRLG